jgi:hypothetical protein
VTQHTSSGSSLALAGTNPREREVVFGAPWQIKAENVGSSEIIQAAVALKNRINQHRHKRAEEKNRVLKIARLKVQEKEQKKVGRLKPVLRATLRSWTPAQVALECGRSLTGPYSAMCG